MIRPSPDAPIAARNADHFLPVDSWLPPRACADPMRASSANASISQMIVTCGQCPL
jgi:hypothetical protein